MTRKMPYFNSPSLLPPNMTRIMGFSANSALRLNNVRTTFLQHNLWSAKVREIETFANILLRDIIL